jgi:hypothetical protein
MTQAEAARACFVSPRTWARWEHGYSQPQTYVKESVRDHMAVELVAYRGAISAKWARPTGVQAERSEP